jgi:predicted transposase YbfD/YdcC
LGITGVDAKSNEIPAAQQLLYLLAIDGAVITADAMLCQKESVAIRRQKSIEVAKSYANCS